MADTPVFQGHHLIEQNAFEQSQLLKSLARSGHFTLHGSDNILNLPANPALATRLGISPHSGGPLSAYSDQLKFVLDDLAETYDGRALLAKDSAPDVRAAAAERMAARIQNLEFTLRAGILNGDLVTNTPENMTPAEANARIRTFFADLDGYQRTHAAQIAELKTLNPTELRWRGVTHSEANVTAALDAIDQSGNSTLSERWGGRASLGTAIQEANQGGRLPLSEHTAARVRTAFNPEMPLTILRPGPTTTAPELAGSAGRAGAAEGAAEAATARGQITGARVLGAAGVAALAVDFAITGHRVAELHSEGNNAGAKSAATQPTSWGALQAASVAASCWARGTDCSPDRGLGQVRWLPGCWAAWPVASAVSTGPSTKIKKPFTPRWTAAATNGAAIRKMPRAPGAAACARRSPTEATARPPWSPVAGWRMS